MKDVLSVLKGFFCDDVNSGANKIAKAISSFAKMRNELADGIESALKNHALIEEKITDLNDQILKHRDNQKIANDAVERARNVIENIDTFLGVSKNA